MIKLLDDDYFIQLLLLGHCEQIYIRSIPRVPAMCVGDNVQDDALVVNAIKTNCVRVTITYHRGARAKLINTIETINFDLGTKPNVYIIKLLRIQVINFLLLCTYHFLANEIIPTLHTKSGKQCIT